VLVGVLSALVGVFSVGEQAEAATIKAGKVAVYVVEQGTKVQPCPVAALKCTYGQVYDPKGVTKGWRCKTWLEAGTEKVVQSAQSAWNTTSSQINEFSQKVNYGTTKVQSNGQTVRELVTDACKRAGNCK
jgi:hypothetical protein